MGEEILEEKGVVANGMSMIISCAKLKGIISLLLQLLAKMAVFGLKGPPSLRFFLVTLIDVMSFVEIYSQ